MILLLCIFLTAFTFPVGAEIVQVSVFWNPGKCNPRCADSLKERFQKLAEVENVALGTGTVTLKWKPGAPFSYTKIKNQLQFLGVGLDGIRVRVRGMAVESGRDVNLVSIGDNTPFRLISIPGNTPSQIRSFPNPAFLGISPDLKESIMREAGQDKVLVIEGPLYRPHRSPPLNLIVERIQVEKKQ